MRFDLSSRYVTGIAIGAVMLAAFMLVSWLTGWQPPKSDKPYRYAYPEVRK